MAQNPLTVPRGERWAKGYRRFRAQGVLQAFAIAGFVYLLIFCYTPMLGLGIAFRNYQAKMGIAGFFTAEWVGLKHFKAFFGDYQFADIMTNTVVLSLLKLVFSFPIPIIFALALNEMQHPKIKRVVQTVSYLPHFISWVIVYGLLFTLFNTSSGMVNNLLADLGFEKVEILTGKEYYWTLAILSDIWKEMGWWSIIFLAAISGVDPSQYESAKVDGATRLQSIWHITLPNIRSTIMVMLILAIGSLLSGGMGGSNFDQSYLLGNSINYSKSVTLPYYVYQVGLSQLRYSYAAAAGLFQSVISLLLVLGSNYASKKLTGTGFF